MNATEKKWREKWWDWTLVNSIGYFVILLIFCMVEKNFLDGIVCAGIVLPVFTTLTAFGYGAMTLSFRSFFIAALSLIGVALRYYFFPEPWYRVYWFFGAVVSWIVYGLISFEAGPREHQSNARSLVTFAIPFIPTALLFYYLIMKQ